LTKQRTTNSIPAFRSGGPTQQGVNCSAVQQPDLRLPGNGVRKANNRQEADVSCASFSKQPQQAFPAHFCLVPIDPAIV